jgi:Fe(3+) dicitrate transport protein
MKRIVLNVVLILCLIPLSPAQRLDSVQKLRAIIITPAESMNGIGRMKESEAEVIYSGRKSEVLQVDSFDANKALNNTRQIIGRIPGLHIIETEGGGFTANGIAFRGLNPYQSIETNTRQNGYNISADIFGYNEAYYLPPMEAVKRIVFVRGASSLAFGPQIGGMINYELREGAAKPIEFSFSQTVGSNNLYNCFTSAAGSYKKLSYYSFLQFRYLGGWRQNSEQQQLSGFAGIKYKVTEKMQLGLEYTALRNTIRMPGGLTDSMFQADPRQSARSRNWLQSPWNILSGNLNYSISNHSSLSIRSAFLYSERDLVWKNEEGGPAAKDSITPALSYVPREVEHEYFRSITSEARFLTRYMLGNQNNTLAFGVRYAYAYLRRQHGAQGTTGTNLDYSLTSAWGGEMNFYNTNAAAFVENTFHAGQRLSITPGLRFEYLRTVADGYDENTSGAGQAPVIYTHMQSKERSFVLSGLALQYRTSDYTNVYASYSQSYRPVSYQELTPFGTLAKIDPALKDASADNIDCGYRGVWKDILNFDAGLFYLHYLNRIGTIYGANNYALRTNTGSTEHKGVETYIELNVLGGLIPSAAFGKLSVYNSYAYVDAHYVAGAFSGNWVEYAPGQIERVGLNYKKKAFSCNMQYSYTASSFGDAGNVLYASDGLSGKIPAYSLVDLSASYLLRSSCVLRMGVNNLGDVNYFTLRTTEYPGPGIIPSSGRTYYAGLSVTF